MQLKLNTDLRLEMLSWPFVPCIQANAKGILWVLIRRAHCCPLPCGRLQDVETSLRFEELVELSPLTYDVRRENPEFGHCDRAGDSGNFVSACFNL